MCPFRKPNRVRGTKIILKIIPVINQIDVGIQVHTFVFFSDADEIIYRILSHRFNQPATYTILT